MVTVSGLQDGHAVFQHQPLLVPLVEFFLRRLQVPAVVDADGDIAIIGLDRRYLQVFPAQYGDDVGEIVFLLGIVVADPGARRGKTARLSKR